MNLPPLLRPAFPAQRPIPAGTYGVGRTLVATAVDHIAHNVGCCIALAWAIPGGPLLIAATLLNATRQHRDDFVTGVESVRAAYTHERHR